MLNVRCILSPSLTLSISHGWTLNNILAYSFLHKILFNKEHMSVFFNHILFLHLPQKSVLWMKELLCCLNLYCNCFAPMVSFSLLYNKVLTKRHKKYKNIFNHFLICYVNKKVIFEQGTSFEAFLCLFPVFKNYVKIG